MSGGAIPAHWDRNYPRPRVRDGRVLGLRGRHRELCSAVPPDAGEAGMPEAAAPQCGEPTIVPNGGTVTIGSTATITPPTGFPANFPAGNAFVYYTTDGTVPSHASQTYSGPIQINATETVRAIAYYPGVCTDSVPTLWNFTTVLPDGGVLVPPAFNPTATTKNNDFLVSLTESGNPAATICFTIGAGTTAPTPTCMITATAAICTGTSQTYNAGAGLGATGSVTINGGVTDANGNVTVNAIACSPGNPATTPVPQQYKLQAANPTMQGTAASPLPWVAGGYMPTLASPTTGASLRYIGYSTGAAPALDCTTGTLLVNGASVGINPGPLPVTQNVTYEGVACKPGYAPSAVESFPYQLVLGAPSFVDATTTTVAEGTGTYDRTLSINIKGAGPGDLWACYSTTAEAPTCGTTANTCGAGATAVSPTTAVAISATATTVTAIDCSLVANASTAATATYTLQLEAPGLDLPGCANTSGTPGTCRAAGAGAPLPTYAFTATQAGMALGTFIEESFGSATPPPSNATQPSYGFACITQGAGNLPSCAATGCANGTNIGTGGAFTTATSVVGPSVNVGDVWNVIGCPGTTAATGAGLAPSAVTSVTFTAPGVPPAPSISPATGTFFSPITASITNTSTSAANLCYTLDGTTPTCTTATGVCGGPGATMTQMLAAPGTSTVTGITLTAGGSGYTGAPTATIAAPATGTQAVAGTPTLGFSVASLTLTAGGTMCAPNTTVTIAAPPAAIMGGIAGTNATATATVSQAGVITGITLTSGGSGYTSAPTVSFTGCTGTAPTATAALATTGSVIGVLVTTGGSGYTTAPAVSFTGGGGTGASAKATLSAPAGTYRITNLQTDFNAGPPANTTLNALLCVAGAGGSAVATQTYTFTIPTPTVSDVSPTAPVNLVSGSTLPIGDQIQFSTPSTFFAAGPLPLSICYTTDGSAPTCPCTGTGTALATVTGTNSSTTASQTTNTAFFATNTLKAIACNTASLQPASGIYTANLVLTAQTPVANPVGGTYYNTQSVTLASTAGTTICYTTGGTTPACAAGACPAGSTLYAGPIPVNQTNTVIKAVSCSTALASVVSSSTYTLAVAPIILTDNPTNPAACPTTATLNFDCATMGECSSATFSAGGATTVTGGVHPAICYSTNGSAVPSCTPVAGSITCFDPTVTSASIPLNQSTTIQALGCLTSAGITFNNSAATLPVTFTPYAPPTITVDGAVTEWTAGESVVTTSGMGTGYFTYNATSLYFALSGGYTPSGQTYVGVYIGNGSATGAASSGLMALGSPPISPNAGIRYAFQWPTDGSAAPVAYAWNAGTASWAAASFTPAVGNTAGTATAEFSIPLSSLPGITSTVTVLGSVVSGVPAAPALQYTFPGAPMGGAYADWYDDVFGSCLNPNQQVH